MYSSHDTIFKHKICDRCGKATDPMYSQPEGCRCWYAALDVEYESRLYTDNPISKEYKYQALSDDPPY